MNGENARSRVETIDWSNTRATALLKPQLALLLRERLHDADAADVLLGLGRVGDPLLHLLGGRPVALAVAEGDPDDPGVGAPPARGRDRRRT